MASYAKMKDRARNNAAIYSVVAIAILIAIPAVITFANDSDQVIHIPNSDLDPPVSLQIWNASQPHSFDMDVADLGSGEYFVSVDTTASIDDAHVPLDYAYTHIQLYFPDTDMDLSATRLTFSTDIENIRAVKFVYTIESWGSLHQFSAVYDEGSNRWTYDLNPVDLITIKDSVHFKIMIDLDEPTTGTTFTYRLTEYSSQDVFSTETVEVMLLIGGLMLIVFALFATPWISVPKVTRTARRAARSVKNGAKKATRSVKRSVKKR